MRVPELKSLARDRGLRNYSRIRKAELVALLQNNGTPEDPRATAPYTRPPPPSPPQRRARARAWLPAYTTLKFDDNGCCRVHSISDGDQEIATNEKYVVIPWKMVTRHGKNMTLAEAVDEIFSRQQSEMKECKRRERESEKKLRGSIRNTMRPI